MKIGILECGHLAPHIAAEFGDYPTLYAQLLSGHGFEFTSFDAVNMEMPEDIHTCDGWLLTGSVHGAYEDVPFIAPLMQFIQNAYAADVPLVGICFGHQIMAQALGGRVEKFAGGWSLGLTDYQVEGIGPQKLNAWHQDQVVVCPPEARIIASSENCEMAGLAYRGSALSVQPHPEFDSDFINALITLRRGAPGYPDDLLDQAHANTTRANTNPDISAMISTFFQTTNESAYV